MWIQEYTAGLDRNGFEADRKTLDAVVRNLEIIDEAAHNLPDEWKNRAFAMEWRWPR